jgi:hypothetical protein
MVDLAHSQGLGLVLFKLFLQYFTPPLRRCFCISEGGFMEWKRTEVALRQEAARQNKMAKVENILFTLKQIYSLVGSYSQNRRMLLKIGKTLLSEKALLLVPCCPDYPHVNGRYIFGGIGSGISLLAQKHIDFLNQLQGLLCLPVVMVYADHEADDLELVKNTNTPREEFLNRISQSIVRTQQAVAEKGWQVRTMTEVIRNLVSSEALARQFIANRPEYHKRINNETLARSEMYWRINHTLTWQAQRERTITTAAQYYVLGDFAAKNNYIVCNHTTVNLSWYLQTDAAVIHNPVSVY